MTALSPNRRIASCALVALTSLVVTGVGVAAEPVGAPGPVEPVLRPWDRKVVQQRLREPGRRDVAKAQVLSPAPVSKMKAFQLVTVPPPTPAQGAADEYQRLRLIPSIESLRFELAESICAPDERLPVTNTVVPPFSGNCLLLLNLGNGSFARGTGWLVSPTLVLTAGHCVHDGGSGDFFEEIEVIPGAYLLNDAGQTSLVRPYGSQKIPGTRLRTSEEWKASGDVARDYGGILLTQPFQSSLGSPQAYSYRVADDAQLSNATLTVAGYPGDKPTGTQWTHSGSATTVEAERLQYMLDTYGGQSGSAVTVNDGGSAVAVGIHNYGGCPNKCTRITSAVDANITTWLSESAPRN